MRVGCESEIWNCEFLDHVALEGTGPPGTGPPAVAPEPWYGRLYLRNWLPLPPLCHASLMHACFQSSSGLMLEKMKSGSPSSSRSSESRVNRKSISRPGSKTKGMSTYGVSLAFSKVYSASTCMQ